MKRLLLITYTALLAAIPSTTHAQENRFGNTPPGKRIVYKHSVGKPRHLEMYSPAEPSKEGRTRPALVLFHGGGWTGGSLAQFRAACEYFAGRGMVCFTAEYRMLSKDEIAQLPPGESLKRVCVIDARSALRWVHHNAPELGIDPARIVVGGGSAGGHISALATRNQELNDPDDTLNYRPTAFAYLWFNPAFAPHDHKDPAIDVLRFLNKDLPPALVFFGTKDSWKTGWDTAYAKLRAEGNTTTRLLLAEGEPHGFFNVEPWRTAALIEADRFFVELGLINGPPTLSPPEKITWVQAE